MTSGALLRRLSRRAGFIGCVILTGVCLIGTVVFVIYAMPSMVLGFAVLTAILAASSAYAGWDWRRVESAETGTLK